MTVSLTPEQVAYLRDIGAHRGGVSAALRWVLEEWCESGGQDDG